jgi:hypothetical protein
MASGDATTSVAVPRRRLPARVLVLRLGSVALALLLVPGAAFSGSGCSREAGGGRACTEIGCEDGVTFMFGAGDLASLPAPVTLTACIDDACTKEVVRKSDLGSWSQTMARVPAGTLDPGVRHAARLTIVDGRGATVFRAKRTVALRATQPNGPGCPPTCRQAQLRVDVTPA